MCAYCVRSWVTWKLWLRRREACWARMSQTGQCPRPRTATNRRRHLAGVQSPTTRRRRRRTTSPAAVERRSAAPTPPWRTSRGSGWRATPPSTGTSWRNCARRSSSSPSTPPSRWRRARPPPSPTQPNSPSATSAPVCEPSVRTRPRQTSTASPLYYPLPRLRHRQRSAPAFRQGWASAIFSQQQLLQRRRANSSRRCSVRWRVASAPRPRRPTYVTILYRPI